MGKMTQEKETESAKSRRSFLAKLWLGLGIVAVAEVAWLVISFLRPRRRAYREDDSGGVIETGPVGGFEPGTVTAFPRGHFYLVRLEDGGFLALSYTCTHLGCTVPWIERENSFVCPCHASAYDMSGNVLRGPAPRALDMFRVFIENDVVKVDTRTRIRRTEFREEQVVHPKKI